jgi:hypothetical protein
VAVSAAPGVIAPGQSVTLTATVTGNVPGGTIQFQVNGVNVGPPVTLVNGSARFSTTQLTLVGSDVITAIYSGDSNHAGATFTVGFAETVARPGGASSGDVPLPPWALPLLGAGLVTAMWQQRGASSRRSVN